MTDHRSTGYLKNVLSLAVIFLVAALAPAFASATQPEGEFVVGEVVVVTLADDTQVTGILREATNDKVILEEEHAGGTIIKTWTIPRAEIRAIAALNATQRAEREMVTAYRNLRRYRLNPATSYSGPYYQQVIDRVLRPFLQRYPESPHAAEVSAKLARWRVEYRKVAAGQVKSGGTWITAEQARRLATAYQAEGAAPVVADPSRENSSGGLARETDWNTPRLLRDIRDFVLTYWPYFAAVLVIGIWYATRRFSR